MHVGLPTREAQWFHWLRACWTANKHKDFTDYMHVGTENKRSTKNSVVTCMLDMLDCQQDEVVGQIKVDVVRRMQNDEGLVHKTIRDILRCEAASTDSYLWSPVFQTYPAAEILPSAELDKEMYQCCKDPVKWRGNPWDSVTERAINVNFDSLDSVHSFYIAHPVVRLKIYNVSPINIPLIVRFSFQLIYIFQTWFKPLNTYKSLLLFQAGQIQ